MKRSNVDLTAIAEWDNLTAAFHRAALGKANREEVKVFRANLYRELTALRNERVAGVLVGGADARPKARRCTVS